MNDESIVRRRFLTLAGRSGAAALLTVACEPVHPATPASAVLSAHAEPPQLAPTTAAAAPTPAPTEVPLTLNATECAFVAAAADTFIPADELSPSGSECGVAVFI